MKYLKNFSEMYEDKYDYNYIISILKKSHGWGMGVLSSIDEFEENDEYFLDPSDDNDYAEKFHIYLTDKQTGRLRSDFNTSSDNRVKVFSPSFYNKLT
jgi:hypothetical protein